MSYKTMSTTERITAFVMAVVVLLMAGGFGIVGLAKPISPIFLATALFGILVGLMGIAAIAIDASHRGYREGYAAAMRRGLTTLEDIRDNFEKEAGAQENFRVLDSSHRPMNEPVRGRHGDATPQIDESVPGARMDLGPNHRVTFV